VAHHRRGLRRLLEDDALAQAIEDDYTSAPLEPRRMAMLRYADKLTRTPGAMQEQDVKVLRDAGFSDADVLGIVQVVGYYAYVNRLADGLGVPLEAD
jgi:uncharacterized peroxidase-related enzyme